MKKYIALILLICLACSMTACGKEKPEEFTIRNGIKFGMSPEEVMAIEGEAEVEESGDSMKLMFYEETILNVPAILNFGFDNNGLFRISYNLREGIYSLNVDSLKLYEEIESILVDEYGEAYVSNIARTDYVDQYDSFRFIKNNDRCVQILHRNCYDGSGPIHYYIGYELLNSSYEDSIKNIMTDRDKI